MERSIDWRLSRLVAMVAVTVTMTTDGVPPAVAAAVPYGDYCNYCCRCNNSSDDPFHAVCLARRSGYGDETPLCCLAQTHRPHPHPHLRPAFDEGSSPVCWVRRSCFEGNDGAATVTVKSRCCCCCCCCLARGHCYGREHSSVRGCDHGERRARIYVLYGNEIRGDSDYGVGCSWMFSGAVLQDYGLENVALSLVLGFYGDRDDGVGLLMLLLGADFGMQNSE